MTSVFFDVDYSDDSRRELLYAGQLFTCSPRKATLELCEFARELAEEAFAPSDPRFAQDHLPVDKYVEILKDLKPRFIHHPRSKELIREILVDAGCDLEKTYFDVPRLRVVTSGGYLTSGLGYAFKPHRDTWYSPPMCQLNWWLPVYDVVPQNTVAFHLRYFDTPIKNSSREFNYQDWLQNGRRVAAQQVKKDTRKQSAAEEPLELDPQLRVVCRAGGMVIFSAAHLHSTVPNDSGETRLSIDFRTVHVDDLRESRGAGNFDSECSGTTIRDYLQGTSFDHLPEDVIEKYEVATGVAALS